MQVRLLNLPHQQDAREHLGEGVGGDGGGGVPHGGVRHTAALRHRVENVAAVLDALRTARTDMNVVNLW